MNARDLQAKKATLRPRGAPPPPKRAPPPRAAYSRPGYYYMPTRKAYYSTPAPRKKVAAAKTMRTSHPDSVGSTIGAYLGHGIQGVIKALTGFGDYKVASNSFMTTSKLGGDPPIMKNGGNGSFRVRHREYLGDISAATSFVVLTYPLNAGMLNTFPWLAQIADSYEQFRFRGVVFEYKSMSSDAVLATSASSALGTVIMSTQYNALDAPFTDKRTMENYEFANSSKPSRSFLHPIECKPSQTPQSELYVRTGAVATGDMRLYDLGNFSIAVQGMQNAAVGQVIGELWVTYEVEFFKPKLLIGGGALLTDHYYGTGTNVFTVAAPFGSPTPILTKSSASNLGTRLQVGAVAPYGANTILFPQYISNGRYLITYAISGTIASAGLPTYTGSGTTVHIDVLGTKVLLFNGGMHSFRDSAVTSEAGARYMIEQVLDINGLVSSNSPAGISIFFAAGAMPTGVQAVDIMITQLSPTIN